MPVPGGREHLLLTLELSCIPCWSPSRSLVSAPAGGLRAFGTSASRLSPRCRGGGAEHRLRLSPAPSVIPIAASPAPVPGSFGYTHRRVASACVIPLAVLGGSSRAWQEPRARLPCLGVAAFCCWCCWWPQVENTPLFSSQRVQKSPRFSFYCRVFPFAAGRSADLSPSACCFFSWRGCSSVKGQNSPGCSWVMLKLIFFKAATGIPDPRLGGFAPWSGRGVFADPTMSMGGRRDLSSLTLALPWDRRRCLG